MSIKLETALSNVSNFLDIAPIIENAKEDISFFGWRCIYVDGYEGCVGIDAIAARFMSLQETHFEPSEEERKIGKKLIPIVSKLYSDNDSRDKNFLTKIFCVFREFLWYIYNALFGNSYGTRFLWGLEDESFFDSYTRSQYEKIFGEPPPQKTVLNLPAHILESGRPDRWYPPNYFSTV
jgi:hypothetical protein